MSATCRLKHCDPSGKIEPKKLHAIVKPPCCYVWVTASAHAKVLNAAKILLFTFLVDHSLHTISAPLLDIFAIPIGISGNQGTSRNFSRVRNLLTSYHGMLTNRTCRQSGGSTTATDGHRQEKHTRDDARLRHRLLMKGLAP